MCRNRNRLYATAKSKTAQTPRKNDIKFDEGSMLEGLRMTQTQLQEFLKTNGVHRMDIVPGRTLFDYNWHEVFTFPPFVN
jgi:molecular chaperone GrpE (heat shock protein)